MKTTTFKRMKTALLLLFLFATNAVFSQYYPDSNSYCKLQPYYDYELCAHGIKDSNGVVLVEPSYSEITLIASDLILVCKNELYGVLNCEFEVVIPIKYESLFWLPKYQHAARHGQNYFWLFETETGTGLMNSSLDVIIPPKNDMIHHVYLEKQSYEYENWKLGQYEKVLSYFLARGNDKYGVYHESGKIIVPQQYSAIKCHSILEPFATPKLPEGIFFHAKNDSTQVIFAHSGAQLFEESAKAEVSVFSLDSSTVVRTIYPDKTSQAHCLETGTSTDKNHFTLTNNHFLLFEHLNYGPFKVYGKNLNQVYEGARWLSLANYSSIKDNSYLILTEGNQRVTIFSNKDEIIFHTQDPVEVFVTEDKTSGCFWTIRQHPEGDTICTYFPNGKPKKTYTVDEMDSDFLTTNYQWQNGKKPLLFVRKGKKWGALGRSGELVIPFKLDREPIPFQKEDFDRIIGGYYLIQSGKMSIINEHAQYLTSHKYDTIFPANIESLLTNYSFYESRTKPEKFTTDDRYLCHFAIRKNKLFSFTEGEERVCDSTFLPFEGNLLLVGHVLVNKNGKVIHEVKTGSIHKAKHFFLHIQGDQAQVVLLSGEKGLKIERFKYAQVERDYVKIKLTDETVGAISLDGKRWLYEPQYYDIGFTNFPPHHAWVKEDTMQTTHEYGIKRLDTYKGRWKLVDTSYNELYDFPFAFPVNLTHYIKAIFESEGKIGLIDSSLNVIFPPEYELIYPVQNSVFSLLYREGAWELGHDSGEILAGNYDFFSYSRVGKNISFVLSFKEKDTLLGLVRYHNGFEWDIPLTEINELAANGSIYSKLIQIDPIQYKRIGIPDSLNRWRVQNNEYIINRALKSLSINNRSIMQPNQLQFTPDFEFNDPYSQRTSQQFFQEEKYTIFDNRAVVVSFTHPEIFDDYVRNVYRKSLYLSYHTEEVLSIRESWPYPNRAIYHNYIYLDNAQEIQLSDILKKDEKTSAFLRKKYTENLTSTSPSGGHCPDMDRLEELIWSSFHFHQDKIYFLDYQWSLSYEELLPYFTELGKRLQPW